MITTTVATTAKKNTTQMGNTPTAGTENPVNTIPPITEASTIFLRNFIAAPITSMTKPQAISTQINFAGILALVATP